MGETTTIGLDLAKSVFQMHGVDASGAVSERRRLRRCEVLRAFEKLPRCLVGLEACGTSHYWGRELSRLGHDVRLMPAAYVKAYVRRNKNDAADAAAICEAVSRPSMRFVAIRSEGNQAACGLHKARQQLVKQRTMLMNHLRGQMAEFGVVVATGPQHIDKLVLLLAAPQQCRIPAPLSDVLLSIVALLRRVQEQVEELEGRIAAWGRSNATCRHLRSAPGYGPILASAMAAHVTDPSAFRSGRDFAASLGLVPRQTGTGGKVQLGPISKRGNGYLRRLLVNGAMSVLNSKRAKHDPWLVKLLATKPRKVAAVALANKMARIGWALMLRQEDFRHAPAAA